METLTHTLNTMSLYPTTNCTTLPLDVLSLITTFCTVNTLQNLTVVNSDFQALAEKLIYTSVEVRTYGRKEGAVATLAVSPVRAAYVKKFRIDYFCPNTSLVDGLVRALGGMKNLRDLRIRLGSGVDERHIGALDNVLCKRPYPYLNVLFLENSLNVRRIAQTHKSLSFLGVHETHLTRPHASISPPSSIASFSNQNHSLLTAAFSTEGNIRGYGRITLVPDFLDTSKAHTSLHTQLPLYLQSETCPGSDPERVTTVVLFIQSVPSEEAFRDFARSLAKAFPNACEVELNLGPEVLAKREWITDALDFLPGERVQVRNWDPCNGEGGDCGQVFRGSKMRFARWLRE